MLSRYSRTELKDEPVAKLQPVPPPATPDLTQLTGRQLIDFIAQAQTLLRDRRAEKLQELRERWTKEAEQEGFTLADIFPQPAPRKLRSDQGEKGADGKKRRAARIKYRDPDDPSNVWTGKGRIPKWMSADMVAKGRNKDHYLMPQDQWYIPA
jgi:DNA-binding protein H-NS